MNALAQSRLAARLVTLANEPGHNQRDQLLGLAELLHDGPLLNQQELWHAVRMTGDLAFMSWAANELGMQSNVEFD